MPLWASIKPDYLWSIESYLLLMALLVNVMDADLAVWKSSDRQE